MAPFVSVTEEIMRWHSASESIRTLGCVCFCRAFLVPPNSPPTPPSTRPYRRFWSFGAFRSPRRGGVRSREAPRKPGVRAPRPAEGPSFGCSVCSSVSVRGRRGRRRGSVRAHCPPSGLAPAPAAGRQGSWSCVQRHGTRAAPAPVGPGQPRRHHRRGRGRRRVDRGGPCRRARRRLRRAGPGRTGGRGGGRRCRRGRRCREEEEGAGVHPRHACAAD
jgi:hypothetical protein